MKKLTALIMAVVLCIGLTACAQKSQDVKNTEVMIRAIGTVTEQSGEDIVTAEKFYNKLPDEEKSQVSNYKDLVYIGGSNYVVEEALNILNKL